MYDNSEIGFLLSRPFLLRMIPSITEEDLIHTSTQAMKDMVSCDLVLFERMGKKIIIGL